MAMVSADAKAVQALLPDGVRVQVDEGGKARLAIEVYGTRETSGVPNYQTAFVVVDIHDHPSRDGTPGHLALWGRVDDPAALAHFDEVYGFPYSLTEWITLDVQEGRHRAVVALGKDSALTLEIEPLADQPFSRQGAVNMLAWKGPGLVVGEVAYLSRGHEGKVTRLEVKGSKDPILALLSTSTPVWSMVSTEQLFTYANRREAALNCLPGQD
jgi:hypothetical protein